MDKEFISLVSREYQAAKHEPEHPSYREFCRETVSQFRGLVNSGWKFTLTGDEPYSSSSEMFRDMRDNKHLTIFSGGNLIFGNPLRHGVFIYTKSYEHSPWFNQFSINEAFRAVHDILGHGPGLHLYETFEGELAAYREHKKWYSPEALPALYSETVGQLCYYYDKGEFVPCQENKILEVRL